MSRPQEPCVTCAQPMGGKFCSYCGEKRVEPDDHAFVRIFGHLMEAFTHADGKIFLTLRTLIARPGQLTADYVLGRRKLYIPALQLFLIANLIFFLLHPLIGGSKTLTTDLETHLHYTWHSAIARAMVAPRLAIRTQSAEAYAAIFNPAAVAQARTLVILMVPVFSFAAMGLYWRCQRHWAVHFVFALHVCAFWLLFISGSLMLTNLAVRLLRNIRYFPTADAVNACGLVLSFVVMTTYLFHAARRVFVHEPTWLTFTKAAALGIALELSLQAYRCALFFITFWST